MKTSMTQSEGRQNGPSIRNLVGNLGADPECKNTCNGYPYACCTLFQNQVAFNNEDASQLKAIKYRLHFFGDMSNKAMGELKKGDFIRIKEAVWTAKCGQRDDVDEHPRVTIILDVHEYELIERKVQND